MAIAFSPNFSQRMANNHVTALSPTANYLTAQLYSSARAFPSENYSSPNSNDATNRLVYFSTAFSFVQSSSELIFNPADAPAATAATAAGTASWISIYSGNFGGAIAGPVSLAGGTGLVHISNDGSGGGSGLTIQVGDIISIIGFRLKWS